MEACRIWTLYAYILLNCFLPHANIVRHITSISGMLTNLPCNITPPVADDQVNLVLWYKDGYGKPLYSFDMRRVEQMQTEKSQAVFLHQSKPTAFLSIFGVALSDQGIYSCRVDFKKSPTRYWSINLTIIEPPRVINLYTSTKKVILETLPVNLNSSVEVTCEVYGGHPKSKIYWLQNDVQLKSATYELSNNTVGSTISINVIDRSHNNTKVTCSGSNNNKTEPISKTMTLVVHSPPTEVYIDLDNVTLTSGRNYTFKCVVKDAYPTPSLLWFVGNTEFPTSSVKTLQHQAIGFLSLQAMPKFNKKNLTCVAWSKAFNKTFESKKTLHVLYSPLLELNLGSSIDENDIVEGDDVYFDCLDNSNPPPTSISWFFNGKQILTPQKTAFFNQRSLILQNVTRSSIGQYHCEAENIVGLGSSKKTLLNVKYAPICTLREQNLDVSKSKNVMCQVESNPPPLQFRWYFNVSSSYQELDKSSFTSERYVSIVNTKSIGTLERGKLYCVSENEIGIQNTPCRYNIRKQDPPAMVRTCRYYVSKNYSLVFECIPIGEDIHDFTLELYDTERNLLEKFVNRHYPFFVVNSQKLPSVIGASIFAQNEKGSSRPVVLSNVTTDITRKQESMRPLDNASWKFPTSVVAVLLIIVLLCLLYFCIRLSTRSIWNKKKKDIDSKEKERGVLLQPEILQTFDTNLTRF